MKTREELKKEFFEKFVAIPQVAHKKSIQMIFTPIDEVWGWIEQVLDKQKEEFIKDLESVNEAQI